VDIAEFTELARLLSRDEFAEKFRGNYLVITDPGEEEGPASFEIVDVAEVAHVMRPTRPGVEIIAIAKAASNPFQGRVSVGRTRNCDIVLRHSSVSKLHAHFRTRPDGQLELVDLDSQNGTRINGKQLQPHKPEIVASGAIVQIGRVMGRIADARVVWDLIQAQSRFG
jgi:hypothetical protein